MNTLPFVIVQHPTEGYRDGPTELELALVLSLVTRNRRRVGLLKRRRKERVRSIARFLWPFYQMGDSVAIDGTGLFETRLKCPTIPQFDNLENRLAQAVTSKVQPRAFLALLRSYVGTYNDAASVETYPLQGCITDPGVLSELSKCADRSVEHVSEQGDALLPERIDPEVAKAAIQTVPRIIMGKQEADVNRLRSITARVDESVSKYLTLLYNQQAELVKQFHQRVEGVRPEIAAQVDNYQTEMSSKIEAIKERFAPWLSTLEADISSWSEREHQWAEEESAHKRSLDEARRAKESASRRLEALKRRQDSEAQRVIHNYANLIEEEWRKIDFLEVERNREADNLQRAQEEIVTLRRRVAGDFSSLMRRVNRLHDVHVRSQGETLQRLYRSSPQIVTVHFPIWICVMESPRGWHYWVFPPVVMVKPSSGLRHLFGTFAGPVLSVEPQARKLCSLLKRKLEDALRRDPSLERQVREKALESNALESPLIVDALDRGLRYLMNHQNLKPEEAQTFDQLFRSLAMSPSGDKG